MPITTRNPVANLPRSIHALALLSIKSSGFAHLEAIQFGSGANTYVATTSRVRKLWNKAAERITRRNPMARTYRLKSAPGRGSCTVKRTYKRQSDNGLQSRRHCGLNAQGGSVL